MTPDQLPKRKISLTRTIQPANWTCPKCHWSNPANCKTCGNCGRPKKETQP